VKGEPGAGEREAESRPAARLPYEKPAVAWEQPLEVQPSLMSGCAKISGGGSACNSTPRS
jgi:hypothetical protein